MSYRLATLSFALLLPIAATQLACQKKAEHAPPARYAILRFENLSGDPALDWTGRAISESLPVALDGVLDGPILGYAALGRQAATLGSRPLSTPGASSERAEAILAGANRLITGYIERAGGQLRIVGTVEDVATGKSLRILTVAAASPMTALDRLAHAFSPHPKSLPTSNPEALRLWAVALESTPGASTQLLEQAINLDPDFGSAWVMRATLDFARRDRASAEAVVAQARRRNLDELSRAQLDLGEANLNNDRIAEIAATRKLVSLSPADVLLLRSLAEAEVAAGEFPAAAADWKKITDEFPNDPSTWNSLGYARSYAGDYAGALAALKEYARLRPGDANPLDSIGDVNYFFGKFNEAAAGYLQAHAKQPGFQQFGDLYKAAWAKFRAGDKPGADKLFAQFRTEREKSSAGIVQLLAGDWLYRTGRRGEAVAALRTFLSETQAAPLRADAYAQATIWDLLQGDREQAAKDAGAIGAKATSAPVFMARFAALPSAPTAEWEVRAERMIPPSMAALRQLALGYALLLDGKREAAIPVWAQIVNATSATDFFARAVYARLQGEKPEHPLLPDPVGLNQFSAVLDTL